MSNNMVKMRKSHRIAREWLIVRGFPFVHIIQHSRWSKDIVDKFSNAKFDGFALRKRRMIFFQVKTGAFPKTTPYVVFAKKYKFEVFLINVSLDGKTVRCRFVNQFGRVVGEGGKKLWDQ